MLDSIQEILDLCRELLHALTGKYSFNAVAFGVELADEGKGVDLVGQGMIEENRGAILLCW